MASKIAPAKDYNSEISTISMLLPQINGFLTIYNAMGPMDGIFRSIDSTVAMVTSNIANVSPVNGCKMIKLLLQRRRPRKTS